MTETNAPAVLIVEDDENLRLGLTDNLEHEGYDVTAAENVAEAEAACKSRRFDLLILDVMLPDGDGYALCRALRERGTSAMILMLTARTLEDDLVQGFDAGADDYLKKPYRLSELLVRVRALLRRPRGPQATQTSVSFGEIVVDKTARAVHRGGVEVPLTKTEFDLLWLLLAHESRVLSRATILDEVWGRDVVVETRTVDNFVSNLKRKLDPDRTFPFRIHTARGVGYRFERTES